LTGQVELIEPDQTPSACAMS